MIGSSLISCRNFLTSLILTNREIPVEYRLMTCLPNASAVFSPFSFNSRCFYSAYVLLIVSSLALSTILRVHSCPYKSALPSSIALFNSSRFLCCSIPSFGVSTIAPKNPSSFNIFSTSAIAFIKRRNRYQIKNNISYNRSINNTSVIIL